MDSSNEIVPTPRDVLNGRGQGVQRHPGNVKYRKLVFVNKGLYAKCPRADKIKISRGIVAAIRQSGGRFLEHNERQDMYFDIGDKKATEKTSQALREGQKNIRKEMFASTSSGDTAPTSNLTMPPEPEVFDKELPKEDYSQYSLLVLEALYNSDRSLPAPPAVPSEPANNQSQHPPPLPSPQNGVNPGMYGGVPAMNPAMYGVAPTMNPSYYGSHSAAMAMALDQFPGARMHPMPMHSMAMQSMAMQQAMPSLPPPAQQQIDRRAQFSLGTQPSNTSFRMTDMSLGSVFSLRQLVESSRHLGAQCGERGTMDGGNIMDRGTFDSKVSLGTLEMIRQSQLELSQVDNMDVDDLTPSQVEIDAFFKRNSDASSEDRVSDLRFSDISQWSKDRFTGFRDTMADDKCRSTESSESTKGTTTSYSGNSLMTDRSAGGISSSDSDMAQLLLGLAQEARNDNAGSVKHERDDSM